ncbi:hypothetical protein ACIHDR_46750 [Nocardia sp. NPDC052278]|uniref:hypothetical protein n=1 Tax=unclassified Nocardia TaxID=2637762 RepID=UPI0036CD5419
MLVFEQIAPGYLETPTRGAWGPRSPFAAIRNASKADDEYCILLINDDASALDIPSVVFETVTAAQRAANVVYQLSAAAMTKLRTIVADHLAASYQNILPHEQHLCQRFASDSPSATIAGYAIKQRLL